jgi:hypothetical protein
MLRNQALMPYNLFIPAFDSQRIANFPAEREKGMRRRAFVCFFNVTARLRLDVGFAQQFVAVVKHSSGNASSFQTFVPYKRATERYFAQNRSISYELSTAKPVAS